MEFRFMKINFLGLAPPVLFFPLQHRVSLNKGVIVAEPDFYI